MMPDVFINGISMVSLGWLRESIDFPTPKPQMETITVPGRNSPIRYTEALGRVSFEPRSFEIVLSMLGSRRKFNQLSEEVINRYSGQLVKVVLSEEADLYTYGTLEMEVSFDPKTGAGKMILSSSDADSYRYYVRETIVTQTGNAVVTLHNDYMPVVPKITATAETVLSWMIGTDTFEKTISAGNWEIPELELIQGENTITVKSSGKTTFTYREGRL